MRKWWVIMDYMTTVKIFLKLKNVTNNTQNKWKIDQKQEKNKNDVAYIQNSSYHSAISNQS